MINRFVYELNKENIQTPHFFVAIHFCDKKLYLGLKSFYKKCF